MNPADRVREAARSAVVKFTALLEYLDHIAKGRDGSPHVNAEDRSVLNALRAALALPVEPAEPDEVGKAREAFYEASLALFVHERVLRGMHTEQSSEWHRENQRLRRDAGAKCDALLAAERAAKEGG